MAPLRRCGGLARERCEGASHRAWVDPDGSCRSFSSFRVRIDPLTSSVFRSWSGRLTDGAEREEHQQGIQAQADDGWDEYALRADLRQPRQGEDACSNGRDHEGEAG